MLHGADISSYQPSDYSTAGLSFVFIKLTEGLSYVNPKWVAQRTTARHAGLVTGFYHYPHIANSPTEEADHFLNQINLTDGDVLCLDWEWYGQSVTHARARTYKDTWISHIKAKAPKHRVIVYSDRSNWLDVGKDAKCGDGLWIADYTTAGHPRVDHDWVFHQFTDSPIDKNVAKFDSVADLRSWAGVGKADGSATEARAVSAAPLPEADAAPKVD